MKKFILLIFLVLLSLKLTSNELPNGKNVISGEVSVSSSKSLMTIDQNTDQAIIEWNSFIIRTVFKYR